MSEESAIFCQVVRNEAAAFYVGRIYQLSFEIEGESVYAIGITLVIVSKNAEDLRGCFQCDDGLRREKTVEDNGQEIIGAGGIP